MELRVYSHLIALLTAAGRRLDCSILEMHLKRLMWDIWKEEKDIHKSLMDRKLFENNWFLWIDVILPGF